MALHAPVVPDVPVDPFSLDTVRADRFPEAGPLPWLDRDDADARIDAREAAGDLSAEQAALCRQFRAQGYVILPGFFGDDAVSGAWDAYEKAIHEGRVTPPPERSERLDIDIPKRLLNPHFHLPEVDALLRDARALDLISTLLGARALPFQTIIGHKGSQQRAHSDSIHMTTYPKGYLAASWIALEDIHPESGPLIYYPGSHRLPYSLARECGIGVEEGQGGYGAYHEKYEPFVQKIIEEHGLEPAYFEANRGDMLIWHANLLHGGSPRRDLRWTRKALVCHYFAEGCVCYHDYAATLSHLHRRPSEPVDESVFDADAYLAANPDVAAAGVDAYQHYATFGFKEGRMLRP